MCFKNMLSFLLSMSHFFLLLHACFWFKKAYNTGRKFCLRFEQELIVYKKQMLASNRPQYVIKQ